ncbi:DUF1573 domain-containing protein [Prevotella sp. A2931]|uniref:DUF1573 domain-containing protein n=1 Tax=Prevotella illustrans TaxID=2800387 RepID=A0ABS3M3H8_9BACT|nr:MULTISPECIES: DUF1573 domain-containing protein [Prevotella]MBO1362691.1 DUF1573 domain-containing protein [Prevotella illustrans]PTL25145.1 hypothetical protein C3V39_10570 [Prevotella sp. oral taxon 820]
MKKVIIFITIWIASASIAFAQQQADIKFDKLVHDFGTFSESNPIQKCTFVFTNTGNAPLIINQAIASCGCAIPSYTKAPIKPGEKGKIDVTYNGKGKFPGHFKKSITIRTNGATEMTRLYIEGTMNEDAKLR